MKTCDTLTTPLEISVRDTLAEIIDPEIGINIVDIGLVYGIEAEDKAIRILLTAAQGKTSVRAGQPLVPAR